VARIVRLVAVALALAAQLPSLLTAAGGCGELSATVARVAAHGGPSSPAGDHGHAERRPPAHGHDPAHCATVSACAVGCVGERTVVASRTRAPRPERRVALEVRVPDSPLVSPEPPPPRG